MPTLTYSVADILDKYLYAKIQVPVFGYPADEEEPIRYVQPGQLVGQVHSWLDPKPGLRNNYWWQFKRSDGTYYYTEHQEGFYSMERLREQGVKSVQEQKDEEKPTLVKAGEMLLKAALIYAGIKIIPPMLKR